MTTRNTIAVALLSLGVLCALHAPSTDRPASSVIVQGDSAREVAESVHNLGGDVTHELGIINAVGARLTPSQRNALGRMDGVTRIYQNASVSTSSACGVSLAEQLQISDDKAKLKLANTDIQTLTVERIDVSWPAGLGQLKKVKFDGHTLLEPFIDPGSTTIDSFLGSLDDRQMNAGDEAELEFEFTQKAETLSIDYLIDVTFAEGCTISYAPSGTCRVSVDGQLEIDDDKIKWKLVNTDSKILTAERVVASWPAALGQLKKVKFGGRTILEQLIDPSSTTIDSFEGSLDDRQVKPGDDADVEFEFTQKAVTEPIDYSIAVKFFEGCTLTFVPSRADSSTNWKAPQSFVPTHLGADLLHDMGITGFGVTVAVLDTGVWTSNKLIEKDTFYEKRVLAGYNAITDETDAGKVKDESGHGTHVSSVALNSERGGFGQFNGVAPDASLVVVQAFDEQGYATYLDVIRGIDWIVTNKDTYGIRVLNLSFGGAARSRYWDDPLNQAVMAAWQAGIVVVASAGNTGPDPMTVGTPGNVPYIITVGAMTDNFTPEDRSDDFLASFSAAGPTTERFVKPEFLAPGGHLPGIMESKKRIPKAHPQFHNGEQYFVMSGTSQAAAAATGAAALLLEVHPDLSPDDVKCRLLASARPAMNETGGRA